MHLILWRHAEAEPGDPDMGRRLTSKGQKQAERMAAWLERHLPSTCRILVSPADRAQQTAKTLKRKFRTVDALAPAASVQDIIAATNWPKSREPVMVVGHQPTLGLTAAHILAGRKSEWSVKKGGVWWFTHRTNNGDETVALRVAIGPDFV